MSEINANPFLLAIDVVDKSVDFAAFLDFLKADHKKDVTIINGIDYADVPRGSTKPSSRSSRMGNHDSTSSIVKNIKGKIETDMQKILESKKKAAAQAEKRSGHRSKSKQQEIARFEGRIDMLYLILNFPYLPHQLKAMKKGGVCIDAFLTLKPMDREVPYVKYVPQPKASGSKSAQSKKPAILGSEYDFQLNPTVYPPARILSLIKTAPTDVAFNEIVVSDTLDKTFKIIEEEIIKIMKSKKSYSEFLEKHQFVDIPKVTPNPDTFILRDFLLFHPNDVLNAIYIQLQEGKWKTVPPPVPETKEQLFTSLFQQLSEQTNRKVVFYEPKEPPDPVFASDEHLNSIRHVVAPLLRWEINENTATALNEVLAFIAAPSRLYAYAGAKFDAIFAATNKKYQLALPLTFFDWQQWNFGISYTNIAEPLAEAMKDAAVVETMFDQNSGMLWIMTMKPIPRTIGHFISYHSMPLCIENISEFIEKVSDRETEGQTKKFRNPPSPANVIKDGLDIMMLLPSIESRIENSKYVYQLPLATCNSQSFIAPYFFENGLHVQILRDIVDEKATFSYKFNYNNLIEAASSSNSIMFQPIEGVRFFIEFGKSMTILFNDQSLCFDGENLTVMSTNEKNLVITRNGTLIFNNRQNIPFIVYPNGSISRFIDNKWITVDSEGISSNKSKEQQQHSFFVDEQTKAKHMIRPDNIEYVIYRDGKRHMVFDLDSIVEQSEKDSTTSFEFPNFPVIICSNGKFTIDIDCFKFVFEEGGLRSNMTANGYSISIDEKTASFVSSDCEMHLSTDFCQFKCDDLILVADQTGIEKVGNIASEEQKGKKTKIVLVDSKWGKLLPIKETITEPLHTSLHKKFLPRFFGIRNNLSGVEFVRGDTIKRENMTEKKLCIPHTTNEEVNILTLHSLEIIPSLFIQFEGLSKTLRANVLKDLHIPKVPKKTKGASTSAETLIDMAKSSHLTYLSDCQLFSKTLENCLERMQDTFLQESQPMEQVEDEQIIFPPQTPLPRLLNMQYNIEIIRHNETAQMSHQKVLNFWQGRESDFSYPMDCRRMLAKDLSPRTRLFDPPRMYREEVRIMTPRDEQEEPFVTQTERQVKNANLNLEEERQRRVAEEKERSVSVVGKDCIDFGRVRSDTKAVSSIKIQNKGKKPLHFFISQFSGKTFRVCAIQKAVIYPGLNITIKVELVNSYSPIKEGKEGKEEEEEEGELITDSFTLKTELFELVVPVKVILIPVAEPPQKETKEIEKANDESGNNNSNENI